MKEIHPNTRFIMDWADRMIMKTDFCFDIFLEALVCFMGEEGQENPSDAAVEKAKQWEEDMTEFLEYIASVKDKWCNSPTHACIRCCEKWKKSKYVRTY